jgi:glycosyltransferase involved in cell wall biosynthesis
MGKILFISAFTPSISTAGQNFSLQLLEELSKNHTIDLLFFRTGSDSFKPANNRISVIEQVPLSPWLKLLHAILFPFFHPIFSGRFSYRVLFLILARCNKVNYDVIYFDFSQVLLYSLFVRRRKKIFMCHDIIFQKYSRGGNYFEKIWVYLSEKILFSSPNTSLLTFSGKDRALVRKVYHRNSEVVNFFLSPMIIRLADDVATEQNTFCFFGAWNRPENSDGLIWFLNNVLPKVPKETKFLIIGPNLPDRIEHSLDSYKNVSYLGFVKNPYETIKTCSALIAPLFQGAGVKVKVIESLACGTPVIGTPIAFEGIPRPVRMGISVCRTPNEFAEQISGFTSAPATKIKLRTWFLEHYKPASLEPFI